MTCVTCTAHLLSWRPIRCRVFFRLTPPSTTTILACPVRAGCFPAYPTLGYRRPAWTMVAAAVAAASPRARRRVSSTFGLGSTTRSRTGRWSATIGRSERRAGRGPLPPTTLRPCPQPELPMEALVHFPARSCHAGCTSRTSSGQMRTVCHSLRGSIYACHHGPRLICRRAGGVPKSSDCETAGFGLACIANAVNCRQRADRFLREFLERPLTIALARARGYRHAPVATTPTYAVARGTRAGRACPGRPFLIRVPHTWTR